MLDVLLQRANRVLLPVARTTADNSPVALQRGEYRPGELVAARFGLLEPAGPWLPATALAEASVVLVPALAVDRTGVRLGRGRGFYDRTLVSRNPHARLVAVIRDEELLDELPHEPHDVPMTHALTPVRGLVELGTARPPSSPAAPAASRLSLPDTHSRSPSSLRPDVRQTHTGTPRSAATMSGVAKCLVEVGLTGDGQQIARVVGEVAAALVVPRACALVPGVGQRHHMVDLHGGRGVGPRTKTMVAPV